MNKVEIARNPSISVGDLPGEEQESRRMLYTINASYTKQIAECETALKLGLFYLKSMNLMLE